MAISSVRESESAAGKNTEAVDTAVSTEKVRAISRQVRSHTQITFDQIKVASRAETEGLLQGLSELTRNPGKVSEWEGWIEWSEKAIEAARKLQSTFQNGMAKAVEKKWISGASREKWVKRFQDNAVGYKQKEYWILHQLPSYMEAWERASTERKQLLDNKKFAELVSSDARFTVIKSEEGFLAMHFDKRKSILADARAALLAGGKGQSGLYAQAKSKLEDAADKGILAHSKVGVWLERIFKRDKNAAQTEKFIKGGGSNDLWSLMDNWADVRKRYDAAADNFKSHGNEQLPRGIHLVTPAQFLNMHYEQRLHYVEELEKRLGGGPDLEREPKSFVKIRHAIDTKDWSEAQLLIADAKQESLSDDAHKRLDSMANYVLQFGSKPMETVNNVTHAKTRLDELLHQVPSSLQPMIMRLLRGPHANRSIHQFRWIVYNNKWCRTHGYLNKQRAFEGASQDNKEMTKHRAEHGEDIGRHDVLDTDTADQLYFRKKEFANHKATYLHVNTDSAATMALAEKMEHEQDPKELYWTTFCGHENGVPHSENWHNDLFAVLTEMRSLTRTINGSGYSYVSPSERLHSMHGGGAPALAA